jgi:hypothetical protein
MKHLKGYRIVFITVVPCLLWLMFGVSWITRLPATQDLFVSLQPQGLFTLNTVITLGIHMMIWMYPIIIYLTFLTKLAGNTWRESMTGMAPFVILTPLMIPLLFVLRGISSLAGYLMVIAALLALVVIPVNAFIRRRKAISDRDCSQPNKT